MKNVGDDLLQLCLAALVLTVTHGCAIRMSGPEKTPTFRPVPEEQRFPLSAALVLNEELRSYQATMKVLLGKNIYPLGVPLSSYAEGVAETLFRRVAVFDSAEAAAGKADVILVPRAERSIVYPTNPSRVVVVVAWQVTDRSGSRPLWLTTVEGDGSDDTTSLSNPAREAFEHAFDDLARKTISAFTASPELHALR